jgi:hypothetical protein
VESHAAGRSKKEVVRVRPNCGGTEVISKRGPQSEGVLSAGLDWRTGCGEGNAPLGGRG